MAPSGTRGGAKVIWVCVHTAEGIRKASDLRAFFDRSSNSSAHAVADDSTLLDALVPYDRAAWTLRNGNEESDNLELCGFASWSRDEWLKNHQGMLANAALWIRRRCQARGIPIVKLSPADVRARKAGVIGHVDYTQGTGDGTHWDPGPGFPWDVVIQKAKGSSPVQEEDMQQDEVLKDSGPGKFNHVVLNTNQLLNNKKFGLAAIGAQLAALAAAFAADRDIDPVQLQSMLDQAVAKNMADQRAFLESIVRDTIPAEQADAIVDALVNRLNNGGN